MATLSAQSETDICNQALSLSGNDRISNIDDASDEKARACALLYPRTRDEVMADSGTSWNIAKARARLSATTNPPFGWDHAYTLPVDLLRVVNQVTEVRQLKDIIPWEREGDNILTNQDTCFILYLKKVTDPVKFPPLLYQAIYTKLAVGLSTRLSINPQMAERLLLLYVNDVLPRAKRSNAAENYIEEQEGRYNVAEAGRFNRSPWI